MRGIGHAVDPGVGTALYPRLYPALAERWVANGFIAHTLMVRLGKRPGGANATPGSGTHATPIRRDVGAAVRVER